MFNMDENEEQKSELNLRTNTDVEQDKIQYVLPLLSTKCALCAIAHQKAMKVLFLLLLWAPR